MGTQAGLLAALGTLVLGLAALVSGTFDGIAPPGRPSPQDGFGGTPGDPDRGSSPAPAEPGADPPRPGVSATDDASPWALTVLVLLVGAAVTVAVIALVIAAGLRIVRQRPLRRGVGVRAGTTPAPDEEPSADDPESLAAALQDGLDAVAEGPPRNAIVASWLRLEEAVTSALLPHHPSDTPTEFVERALSTYGLDEGAIRRLAVLYEEARFSQHPLTEAHRREARDCLDRLLARLAGSAR